MDQPIPYLVFADDWGRHPSSCQHLIRQLLPRHPVVWVNTIGMRPPRLDRDTFRRGFGKLRQWFRPRPLSGVETAASFPPSNLRVVNPRMWPWYTHSWDRRLNDWLLTRQLVPLIREFQRPPVALTTIPIVAGLIGQLPVAGWVYYRVDDFSQWPGLDGRPLAELEQTLVQRADTLIAVSTNLQEDLARAGRSSHLLTHGADLEFWAAPTVAPASLERLERPLVVFWGVVDRRMDLALVRHLTSRLERGTLVLAGPTADPDPALLTCPRTISLGSVPFDLLPGLAREAAVLVMPYADLPVTRAMQPLKLKEYLATGRPVVASNLPANQSWADALDLAATPEAFTAAVFARLKTGLPAEHAVARQRLRVEGWHAKALLLEQWVEEPLNKETIQATLVA